MTDQQHLITPPTKFVRQWLEDFYGWSGELPDLTDSEKFFITKAAQWGYEQGRAIDEAELQKVRDEELEACCEAFEDIWDQEDVVTLNDVLRGIRAARRPSPPSLKEQALQAIENADGADYPVVATVLTAD